MKFLTHLGPGLVSHLVDTHRPPGSALGRSTSLLASLAASLAGTVAQLPAPATSPCSPASTRPAHIESTSYSK